MEVAEIFSGNHEICEVTANKIQYPEVILHAYR